MIFYFYNAARAVLGQKLLATEAKKQVDISSILWTLKGLSTR